LHGITYSKLISGLNKKEVNINRKVLAELAVHNPEAFTEIVNFVKA
jgi:large subunit ribosomal protein L20